MKVVAYILVVAAVQLNLLAAEVAIQTGNVVYTDDHGTSTQITFTGHEIEAVLSPDGQTIAFAREYREDWGDQHGLTNCSIWIADVSDLKPRMIVSGQQADRYENVLTDLGELTFSPDSTKLYFHSLTWATSYALHSYDMDAGTRRYICPGSLIEVVSSGERAGHLTVKKHMYHDGGGSYDEMRAVMPEGDNQEPVNDVIVSSLDYPDQVARE